MLFLFNLCVILINIYFQVPPTWIQRFVTQTNTLQENDFKFKTSWQSLSPLFVEQQHRIINSHRSAGSETRDVQDFVGGVPYKCSTMKCNNVTESFY